MQLMEAHVRGWGGVWGKEQGVNMIKIYCIKFSKKL